MDPWSINSASQTLWPSLFCTHLFLTFWLFFFFFLSSSIVRCIIWTLNKAIKDHNNSEHHFFFNTYFPDFLAIFLDFLKHFLWLDLDPEPWTQPLRTMNIISKFIYICLSVCQVVIQTYPFASIQSMQAFDGEVDGICA